MLKFLLVLTIIISTIIIVVTYADYDRKIRLAVSTMDKFKVPAKESGKKNLLVILSDYPPSVNMIKSLLDQSIVPNEIVVETTKRSDLLDRSLRDIVKIRLPGSTDIRERDVGNTLVVKISGRDEYLPYDFIETYLSSKK